MLVFRKLLAHESACLKDHLLRLDDQDRRLRFGHAVSAEVILAYVDGLVWSHSWIVGAFEGEVLRGVAELRDAGLPGSRPGRRIGELSVTVEPAWRNRGVATRLLEEALLVARNRGFETLYLLCLPENQVMQHVARRLGERLSFRDGDVEVLVRAPEPDPLSVFSEMIGDALALWRAALGRPLRLPDPH